MMPRDCTESNSEGGIKMLVAKVNEIRRRLEAGLSREKLSILAGLPSNSVFRIEKGMYNYTYSIRARALAETLRCGGEDIFTKTKGS